MHFEIMKTATEHSKPIWDTVIMIVGGLAIFLQSAIGSETLLWAKVFSFIGVGVFGIVRAIYWIINDGYKGKEI